MNNRMFETMAVPKLFRLCVIPSVASMTFSALYTIADGIFVGHFIGAEALAAVNLVMPLIMIVSALADMVAAGSSVRIAILLGENNLIYARKIFSFCLTLIAAVSLIFGIAGYFLAEHLIALMGATGPVAEYAVDYLRIYMLFMPLCSLYYSTDNYLRVCEKQNLSMAINIVCSVLNVVLDYILIVVMGKGLWAAALASCLSMSAGALWSLIPFLRRRLPLFYTRGRIDSRQFLRIIVNGSSEFFVSIAGSMLAIVMNMVLIRLGGANAVAAVAIVEYVESVTGMVIFSIDEAMQPAISFCYGAGLRKRMMAIQKWLMGACAVFSIFAMLLLLFGGQFIIPFFVKNGDTALFEMSRRAMTFCAFSYLVSWVDGTLSGFMTALEKPLQSLVIAMAGTVVLPAVGLATLVPAFGLDGVWMLPIFTGTLSAIFAVWVARRTIKY